MLLKIKKGDVPRSVAGHSKLQRPTEWHFEIRWEEALTSDWNRLARNVVVRHIEDGLERSFGPSELEYVRNAFKPHVATIRKRMRQSRRDESDLRRVQKRQAVTQRKMGVSAPIHKAIHCLFSSAFTAILPPKMDVPEPATCVSG